MQEDKNKKTATSKCAQGSFEGAREQLLSCSAQIAASCLAEVDVSILCLPCFFDYFV